MPSSNSSYALSRVFLMRQGLFITGLILEVDGGQVKPKYILRQYIREHYLQDIHSDLQ
jgi:hypothetical protein